jgi:hypothetical protein
MVTTKSNISNDKQQLRRGVHHGRASTKPAQNVNSEQEPEVIVT